jgi:uncharacterized protein (TIGR04255 family)
MGKITFERPPLVEVSFGLSFAPLRDFRTSHFGAFWTKLRPDFVETADKPIVAETPGALALGSEWFPLPRVWYVHKNKEQLLQLQTDRFYFNWRKSSDGSLYPRFDSLEPVFLQHLSKLSTFVRDESLGALDISKCELTYTNHIFQGEGWSDLADAGALFPGMLCQKSPPRIGMPKGVAWQGHFEQEHMRLRADIKHGYTNDDPKRELFVFELRATSRRKVGAIDTVREAFSAANETIVNAFVDLTSATVQKEQWKRVGGA